MMVGRDPELQTLTRVSRRQPSKRVIMVLNRMERITNFGPALVTSIL